MYNNRHVQGKWGNEDCNKSGIKMKDGGRDSSSGPEDMKLRKWRERKKGWSNLMYRDRQGVWGREDCDENVVI